MVWLLHLEKQCFAIKAQACSTGIGSTASFFRFTFRPSGAACRLAPLLPAGDDAASVGVGDAADGDVAGAGGDVGGERVAASGLVSAAAPASAVSEAWLWDSPVA